MTSNTVTNAIVASNDIWKPGESSASGRRDKIISAASAKDRKVKARRDRLTPPEETGDHHKGTLSCD
jgi:hypothetical protein